MLKIAVVSYVIAYISCFGWIGLPYAYGIESNGVTEESASAISQDSNDELLEEEGQESDEPEMASESEDVTTEEVVVEEPASASPDITEMESDVSVQSLEDESIQEDFSLSATVSGISYHAFLSHDGNYYLYLPAGSPVSSLAATYTGSMTDAGSATFDAVAQSITFPSAGTYKLVVNNNDYTVVVNVSNLPAVSFTLNGTDLATINAGSKDIKYAGNSLSITNASGGSVVSDSKVELKGRGNASWTFPKRGYQFKLSSKTNLFGMGKSKTWILIANYGDASLLRNALAFTLAQSSNMPYTSNYQFVDMWVDGEYQGTYFLCEKVQVGDNRIELDDPYGIVVELDNNYYAAEDLWFQSSYSTGKFVLKDSVADGGADEQPAFNSFKTALTEFEAELYGGKDWNKISKMIDADSFVDWYFIQEFAENADAVRSSMFMYKNGESDVIHLGPVWDFDLAFGNCYSEAYGGLTNVDYVINARDYTNSSISWFKELFRIPEFRALVVQRYNSVAKPAIARAQSIIDSGAKSLSLSAEMNFKRWNVLGQTNAFGSYRGHTYLDTYAGEVSYLKNWTAQRAAYLESKYSNLDVYDTVLSYSSHVQNVGWTSKAYSGDVSGTTGRALRMEALQIDTPVGYSADSIQVSTHVQNIGWQGWTDSGQVAGTSGKALRMEAIRIKLNGELANNYDIYYRVHVQNQGWMGWAKNGEAAGTQGMSLRIEAVQIKLVPKGTSFDVGGNAFLGTVTYASHVQNVGWQPSVSESLLTGTSGQSLRMEAIRIDLNSVATEGLSGTIRYRVHVQTIGWQNWVGAGQIAGTTGRGLRIETLQVELTGELAQKYDVVYRVHVQNVGWTDWVKNGEVAGTTGRALRMEALELKLVRK
jgi:uncharacterized protein YjdB